MLKNPQKRTMKNEERVCLFAHGGGRTAMDKAAFAKGEPCRFGKLPIPMEMREEGLAYDEI